MPDFEQIIPELKQWETDIDTWIRALGRYDHAIAYLHLFWPEFKLHDECVLFADCPVPSYEHWMKHTSGVRTAVEKVLNHRHILDLFMQSEFKPTQESILCLGQFLRDMWSCKLARDFPGRTITVEFDESYCENLVDYQITFYHISR